MFLLLVVFALMTTAAVVLANVPTQMTKMVASQDEMVTTTVARIAAPPVAATFTPVVTTYSTSADQELTQAKYTMVKVKNPTEMVAVNQTKHVDVDIGLMDATTFALTSG